MLTPVGVNASPLVVTVGVEPEGAGAAVVVVVGLAVVVVDFAVGVVLVELLATVVTVVATSCVVVVTASVAAGAEYSLYADVESGTVSLELLLEHAPSITTLNTTNGRRLVISANSSRVRDSSDIGMPRERCASSVITNGPTCTFDARSFALLHRRGN